MYNRDDVDNIYIYRIFNKSLMSRSKSLMYCAIFLLTMHVNGITKYPWYVKFPNENNTVEEVTLVKSKESEITTSMNTAVKTNPDNPTSSTPSVIITKDPNSNVYGTTKEKTDNNTEVPEINKPRFSKEEKEAILQKKAEDVICYTVLSFGLIACAIMLYICINEYLRILKEDELWRKYNAWKKNMEESGELDRIDRIKPIIK